ncbi:MAG: hypothetical protein AAF518_02770 [Spirochaetota bacterium]
MQEETFEQNPVSEFLRQKFSGGCLGCWYCENEVCGNADIANINYKRKVSHAMICQFYHRNKPSSQKIQL